jgi:hypothetical protein
MIKANELRIGNIVNHKGVVVSILPNDILALYQREVVGNENNEYQPIRLTEGWLADLGFRLESTSKWVSGYNSIKRTDKVYTDNVFYDVDSPKIQIDVIYNEDETVLRRIGIKDSIGNKTLDIKYVHELQNIYFSLCGEELTLKETVKE